MNSISVLVLAAATTQRWYNIARPTSLQDLTGAAAVLISGLAIWQTQRQIRAGAKAGEQQRKDIVIQQKQIERQLELQSEQAITGPFFEMLAILQSIVKSTSVYKGIPGVRMEGWNAFLVIYQTFASDVPDSNYYIPPPNGNDPERRRIEISGKYRQFHRQQQTALSHYFRFLYNIVRYVNESKLNDQKKEELIRLLRSQLSQHQLLLLYYNGLTDELGYPRFFKLIRQYRLLDNLDKGELIVESDRELYERLPMPV